MVLLYNEFKKNVSLGISILSFSFPFFLHLAPNLLTKGSIDSDVEFDLENDTSCVYTDNNFHVRWLPDIFENPVSFTATGIPKSAEIVQGAVEDCYLVSSLSTIY